MAQKKGLVKGILDDFFAGYIAIAQKELEGSGRLYQKLSGFISHAVHYFDTRQKRMIVFSPNCSILFSGV